MNSDMAIKSEMELVFIVVTYNSRRYIEQCLHSLSRFEGLEGVGVVVIDNASSDGTRDIVRAFSKVRLIELDENLGFGMANNIACSSVASRYYFLLNADAFMSAEIDIQRIVSVMDKNPTIAIAGLPLIYPDSSTQTSSYSASSAFKWLLQLIPGVYIAMRAGEKLGLGGILARYSSTFSSYSKNHNATSFDYHPAAVDWVCGAAMLVAGSYIKKHGLFDENIFLYAEDEDLCRVASQAGWGVVSIASPPLVHVHGWNSKNKFNIAVSRMKFKSLQYFIDKHHKNTINGFFMKILLPFYVFGFGRNYLRFICERSL